MRYGVRGKGKGEKRRPASGERLWAQALQAIAGQRTAEVWRREQSGITNAAQHERTGRHYKCRSTGLAHQEAESGITNAA
jgi:hypothetical protein